MKTAITPLIARPLMLAATLALLSGCGADSIQPQQTAPVPVDVITVQAQPFEMKVELPGRIEAARMAEVRARVAGTVLSRHFREGDDVKAGQVLFQVDPAPLTAALARAQGELARADAAVSNAHAVVWRNQPLAAIEAISKQDFETAQAALKTAQAARVSAAAELETAKLNLKYATVRAPIGGRIGRALVNEGTLVGQGEATPMAVIQQLSPVYADFRQPAADMLRWRAALDSGKAARPVPLSVRVDGADSLHAGRLMFADSTVDRSTGEVLLRGQFDNHDGRLLPGMYVRVQVGMGVDPDAILVPQRAVSRGADGQTQVMTVGKGDIAMVRPVRAGAMSGGLWHIRDGLKPGDRVIVDGYAAAGTKVVAQPAPARKG